MFRRILHGKKRGDYSAIGLRFLLGASKIMKNSSDPFQTLPRFALDIKFLFYVVKMRKIQFLRQKVDINE